MSRTKQHARDSEKYQEKRAEHHQSQVKRQKVKDRETQNELLQFRYGTGLVDYDDLDYLEG